MFYCLYLCLFPLCSWVSFVWSPYLLGTVIVLLCAAVLRSRWKRKGLEADIELLRQQTSSAQTPSTPQSLDTVVSKLVAEGCMPPGVEDMLSEQFARRSASKSESSVSIAVCIVVHIYIQ